MKERNIKGITLIALVITIIVLLILVAVSIATLTGENGILTKASQAEKLTVEGKEKEQISLAYNVVKTEKIEKGDKGAVTAEEMQPQLDNQDAKAIATDKRDKIEITFQETGNQYIVNGREGKIEEAKEMPITFKIPNGFGEEVEFKANLGDTWEDFFNLDIAESGRDRMNETNRWGLHYVNENGTDYVMTFGYMGYGEYMGSILGYNGEKVKVKDKIVADASYGSATGTEYFEVSYYENLDNFWNESYKKK